MGRGVLPKQFQLLFPEGMEANQGTSLILIMSFADTHKFKKLLVVSRF